MRLPNEREFQDLPADDPASPNAPVWDDVFAAKLLGKRALVGVRVMNGTGEAMESRFELHGRIVEASWPQGLCLACEGQSDGRLFRLPPQTSIFSALPPGEYRLRFTGEVVIDPEFAAQWTIYQAPSTQATD